MGESRPARGRPSGGEERDRALEAAGTPVNEGPQHALLTIRFTGVTPAEPDGVTLIRYWYYVPRIGDQVFLSGFGPGVVTHVCWTDDYVDVALR